MRHGSRRCVSQSRGRPTISASSTIGTLISGQVINPGEIISFRTPEGVKRQKDLPALVEENPTKTGWHSCALFISDNIATQIDGLGHATEGEDDHWYNGFRERDWGGNWGIRKCDATTIPPVVARGVVIDVAGSKNVEALPSNYAITRADLE